MKRLGILVLALAGMTALLSSCGGGGEEEAATLAVAFRLDEGSPVMVAYIGDPTEDPFELPAGRYYIEALDGDDVLLSLGAVDIDDGDGVDFPPSFEAAGGVADPQQAEPLITLASFLIDVELAELTFWEIVTGGFTESPFDPAVELDADAFQSLFEMYGDIVEQGDAVLEALYEIDGRAEVSSSVSYVRSSWARELDSLEEARLDILNFLLLTTVLTVMKLEEGAEVEELLPDLAAGVILAAAEKIAAEVHNGRKTPQKSEGLLDKKRKWQEYAKTLGDDLTGLEKKIKSDLKELLPGATDKQIDDWARSDLNEIRKALGKPSAPSTSPTRPMGATLGGISFYWQGMGCSESEIQGALDSLSKCIDSSANAGSSFSQILERCSVSQFEPDCVSEPTEEPEEPEPTPSPTAEGRDVEAVGEYYSYHTFATGPPDVVVRNTVTLRFNTGGGPVSGEGYLETETLSWLEPCPEERFVYSLTVTSYNGTYDPDSRKFSGTYEFEEQWFTFDLSPREGWHCEPDELGNSGSAKWEATLADGIVLGGGVGEGGPADGHAFELTVQD